MADTGGGGSALPPLAGGAASVRFPKVARQQTLLFSFCVKETPQQLEARRQRRRHNGVAQSVRMLFWHLLFCIVIAAARATAAQ
jgi:hypothetical protein